MVGVTPSAFGTDAGYALIIFAMGMIGGLLPLATQRIGGRALGIGSAFGGGVFVAAGAVHLLPDASQVLDTRNSFPVATTLASSTMLAFLLVGAIGASEAARRRGRPSRRGSASPRASLSTATRSSLRHLQAYLDAAEEGTSSASPARLLDVGGPSSNSIPASDVRTTATYEQEHAGELDLLLAGPGLWTAGAMFLALSVHSFLAGLSLGVTQSRGTQIASFAAIIAHKSVAAFALGAALVRARTTPRPGSRSHSLSRCTIACWMTLFAAVTPVGVLIGAALAEFDSRSATAAVLMAVAAGTFLYVGLIEVLSRELSLPDGILCKACAAVLGYCLFALLAVWI